MQPYVLHTIPPIKNIDYNSVNDDDISMAYTILQLGSDYVLQSLNYTSIKVIL